MLEGTGSDGYDPEDSKPIPRPDRGLSREIHRSFAQELHRIVERATVNKPRLVTDTPLHVLREHNLGRSACLHWNADPRYCVLIMAEYSEERRDLEPYFMYLPSSFKIPAVALRDFHTGGLGLVAVTTPYGVLSSGLARGVDGHLYQLRNIYYFNIHGQGLKLESIEPREYLEDKPDFQDAEYPLLDFTPSPKDSKFVDLKSGDYEKVGGIINQIETGKFELPYGNFD